MQARTFSQAILNPTQKTIVNQQKNPFANIS